MNKEYDTSDNLIAWQEDFHPDHVCAYPQE